MSWLLIAAILFGVFVVTGCIASALFSIGDGLRAIAGKMDQADTFPRQINLYHYAGRVSPPWTAVGNAQGQPFEIKLTMDKSWP